MTYKEMINKFQHYAGLPGGEAEHTLRTIIEKLSLRLQQEERYDFASQLPAELQEVAIRDEEIHKLSGRELIDEICAEEDIDESKAKHQLRAVWMTLEDAISPGEIEDIKANFPNDLAAELST
jgi:uncharacterized protein (DUF2267 family)